MRIRGALGQSLVQESFRETTHDGPQAAGSQLPSGIERQCHIRRARLIVDDADAGFVDDQQVLPGDLGPFQGVHLDAEPVTEVCGLAEQTCDGPFAQVRRGGKLSERVSDGLCEGCS